MPGAGGNVISSYGGGGQKLCEIAYTQRSYYIDIKPLTLKPELCLFSF